MNIGETICKYRQMRKMTQEEFALRIGVTAQAVSKWERGNGLPDVSLLAGICKVLRVSANQLIGVEEKVVENGNAAAEQEIRSNMIAEPLVLEFGRGFLPYFESEQVTDYVHKRRMLLVGKTGKLMPLLRMRDNVELDENAYRIISYDDVLLTSVLDGEEMPFDKMIDDVAEICDKYYAKILNKNLVKIMIDNLAEMFPGVVDDIIPSKISYLQVKQELKRLVEEGKSIRNLMGIVEDMELNLL